MKLKKEQTKVVNTVNAQGRRKVFTQKNAGTIKTRFVTATLVESNWRTDGFEKATCCTAAKIICQLRLFHVQHQSEEILNFTALHVDDFYQPIKSVQLVESCTAGSTNQKERWRNF